MAYLTGFHAIEEHIRAGKTSGVLLVAKAGPRAREIAALAAEKKIRVERAGVHELDRLAKDHRGVVLEIDGDPSFCGNFEEMLDSLNGKENALVVILDEITDPHNYGAIIRSCDQFGADMVIIRNKRTARHSDIVAKSSAGAAAWIPIAETPNLPRAVEALKAAGFWIYGADMSGECIFDRNMRGRCAVIFGSEGGGLSRLLRETCDVLVAVPSLGRIDSLNVSVAAGVVLYEITRQRLQGHH
ncbi:MAG: 23S rRNA (guanosine(2251)-2'-O)-methyltransferase RlmB [Spirochaetaceae bacterium]|jgi:23S rRNA (guanosine2251-2'-O)-methyltransferase|nr:23S rRNA (guanosine(2251)-2'-O)-methyltransferase RlmB [Spirochaetaceae bacterium]